MLCNLLARTDRERFEPMVVSLIDDLPLAERVERVGIPVRAIGMRPGVPDPRGVVRLARLLHRERPQVVQTWMDHSNLIGGVAARLRRPGPGESGGCITPTTSPGSTKRTTLMTVAACARLSRRLPARIVCCSESARAAYARRGFAAERADGHPQRLRHRRLPPRPRGPARRRAGSSASARTPRSSGWSRGTTRSRTTRTSSAPPPLLKGRLPGRPFPALRRPGRSGERRPWPRWSRRWASGAAATSWGRGATCPGSRPASTWRRRHPSSEAFPLASARPWPAASRAWRPTWATRPRSSARRAGSCPPRDPQALAAACEELLELSPDARGPVGPGRPPPHPGALRAGGHHPALRGPLRDRCAGPRTGQTRAVLAGAGPVAGL